MSTESLSFTLRPVEDREDLLKACQVRAAAYGRKDPRYLHAMAEPDLIDESPHTTVFLCEDKATGRAVGTMRIQATTRGATQIEIEKYVAPPAEMMLHGRAEVTRLSSVLGADPMVRLALWKASYLYCMAIQVRWLLMGVKKPALIKAYERMGAKDVFDDHRFVTIGHGGNLPHRIFALDIGSCERAWRTDNNPMLNFMVGTVHPDLSVVPSMHRYSAVVASEKIRLHVVQ